MNPTTRPNFRMLSRYAADGYRFHRSRPQFVTVLGMHRSGTSCAVRILNLMGASLGPLPAVPDDDMRELHWESPEMVWINDEILKRNGGTWSEPPPRLRLTARDYWRARTFIWRYGGANVAVVKDPRMLLTYRLWRTVLPPHTIVACFRHPLNVARSLQHRDGFPIAKGLEIWTAYNTALLDIVAGASHVHWFDFDCGSSSALSLIRQCACVGNLRESAEAVAHYSDLRRHHRADTNVPRIVASVYERLERAYTASDVANGEAARSMAKKLQPDEVVKRTTRGTAVVSQMIR